MSTQMEYESTESEMGSQHYTIDFETRNVDDVSLSFTAIADIFPTSRSLHIPAEQSGPLQRLPQEELIGAIVTVEVEGDTVEGYVDAFEWTGSNNQAMLFRLKSL